MNYNLLICCLLYISCIYSQSTRIDHIIYLVNDLEETISTYESKGFTIKRGYKHENGIENAHIKFNNESSVEFISLYKQPTDAIAIYYQEQLVKREGFEFICLTGIDLDTLSNSLNDRNIEHTTSKGKFWSYLTFPKTSALSIFFFIEYKTKLIEDKKYTSHTNGINQIENVSIQGNYEMIKFLELLDLEFDNKSYKTSTGNIIIESKNSETPQILRTIASEGNTTNKIMID